MSVAGTGLFSCGYCGRPCASYIWLNGVPYHEECTHGPSYQPRTYAAPQWDETALRRIVREEIERLKDQIEAALGARP